MSVPALSLEFDPEADAIYVWLGPAGSASHRTEVVDDRRAIDRDRQGNPVGVEFLGVSRGVHLAGIPEAGSVAGLFAKLSSIRRSPG